jgi:ribosome biogenesis GTPase
VPGRVVFENQGRYRVITTEGEIAAVAAGRLRYEATSRDQLPAVGDWVALDVRPGRHLIQSVLPRRSQFVRKVAGAKTEPQVVGANIDTVFILTSLNQDFSPRRVERYLAVARESGARPVVVLSKADLCAEVEAKVRATEEVAAEAPVHALSVVDRRGVDALAAYFAAGETVAVLGTSGVGKSTLINHLLGEERLRVAEIRAGDDRGKHTTRHRELFLLPGGGLVLDTPGMRELQLWEGEEGLGVIFAEIEALARDCFFADCRHASEPRCNVRAALEEGTLSAQRFESYGKLQRELKQVAIRKDEALRQREHQHAKRLTKAAEERARFKRGGS